VRAGTFFGEGAGGGAENISYVLPKNGQPSASTSNFNESRVLHNL